MIHKENGGLSDARNVGTKEASGHGSMQQLCEDGNIQISAWAKIVKRSIIMENNIQFRYGVYCEDMEWCAMLLRHCNTVAILNNKAYQYRQREGSITHTIMERKIQDISKSILMLDCIKKRFCMDQELDAYRAEYAFATCLAWMNRILLCGKEDEFSCEIEKLRELLDEMLKEYKIRSKKKYAYMMYRSIPELYISIIKKYYKGKIQE